MLESKTVISNDRKSMCAHDANLSINFKKKILMQIQYQLKDKKCVKNVVEQKKLLDKFL